MSVKTFDNRCGYRGHFYRVKWPFYRGKLTWCVWPDFHEINLPTGKYPYPREKSQQGFQFDFNMKPPKNVLVVVVVVVFDWDSFALLRKIDVGMADFTSRWEKIFNWFVRLDLVTIFPKNIPCIVRCSWTAKWNPRWSVKKAVCTLVKLVK